MPDRRLEPRLLCADLVNVQWTDETGQARTVLANLEDISLSGACLQLDTPIPQETVLRLMHRKLDMRARVRYCVFRDTGYFLGVKFEPGFQWSRRLFRPKHMLDPRSLAARTRRAGNKPPQDQ